MQQFRFNLVVRSDDTGETSVIESVEVSAESLKMAINLATKQIPSNESLVRLTSLCP